MYIQIGLLWKYMAWLILWCIFGIMNISTFLYIYLVKLETGWLLEIWRALILGRREYKNKFDWNLLDDELVSIVMDCDIGFKRRL